MIKTANLTGPVSRDAGGLFESVRRLVQSLQSNGMEVCVLGTMDGHTAEDISSWAPVKVRAFPARWPKAFGYSPEFREALEEFKPDVTHTHGLWLYASVATNQYCAKHKVPYLISAHGMLDAWAIQNSRWKKLLAHFFYEGAHLRRAGCLRALCESEADAIRKLGLKNPIAIIPNGIDLPPAGGQKIERRAAPWNSVILPGQKVLLFLSRIHRKKGLINLVKAWAMIQQLKNGSHDQGRWVLAIAGWDQEGHEIELKHCCDELGIVWTDMRDQKPAPKNHAAQSGMMARENVISSVAGSPPSLIFLGPQFNEGKAACYTHCDGFVLPSFSEGVPMVVLEAWAYRKAVLMTPECNLPIGYARAAAIKIETSAESIANGLSILFKSSEAERQALGEQGQSLVREQFVWPVIGHEMAELYRWILGGGEKPDCVWDH